MWAEQIAVVGANVDIIHIGQIVRATGILIKDLNDVVALCSGRIETLAPLLP